MATCARENMCEFTHQPGGTQNGQRETATAAQYSSDVEDVDGPSFWESLQCPTPTSWLRF